MKLFFTIIIAYLLGSINSSILVSRLYANIDIREHGSGNAGATNTLRTLGKTAAAIVLFCDVLKGIISVIIGRYLTGQDGAMIAGIFAVLGHNYPVLFGFKGGKGILTSIAVVFMIDWKVGIIVLGVALSIMAVTRYVSLGSIIGAIIYPIIIIITNHENYKYILFALCLAVLAVYRHRANIRCLLEGTESKLGSKVNVK